MEWTNKKPNKKGWYNFVKTGTWPVNVFKVSKGSWQLTQNPDEWYANSELVSGMNGRWFGPLPEES